MTVSCLKTLCLCRFSVCTEDPPKIYDAVCRFEPTYNDGDLDAEGYVILSAVANTIQVTYNISGLTPGEHAW